MAKKGLGRGLGAIFGEEPVSAAPAKSHYRKAPREQDGEGGTGNGGKGSGQENVPRETLNVRISMIEPNTDQPRKNFDEESLAELAESIKTHGVIQPVIVRKQDGMYRIIVGERRWRAARMAGLKEIPVIIKDADDRETAELALIENIQRQDLNSVEEARAYRALIDSYGLTQEELAERVSKNRSSITNSLRLLQLDDEILDMVENGELSAGHARALLSIQGKRARYKAAKEISSKTLSVRDAEKLAKRIKNEENRGSGGKTGNGTDIYLAALAEELTECVKYKVEIRRSGRNGGKIEISFGSDEELEEIADKLREV